MNLTYIKPEKINMKANPDINENWLKEKIIEDSSILGLGELIVKDVERIQPRAGRLDLLLQEPESNQRYEVEVQLGSTDESHIIRTIEYWDIERKRYPQYEHAAVIVAEDITSRFFNVISLFNGFIPLIAIQINAIKFGDKISLVATKILDQVTLGYEEEDDDITLEVVDRAYWEKRASRESMTLTDKLLSFVHTFNNLVTLKYNKFYMVAFENDKPNNFMYMIPQKRGVRLTLRLSREVEEQVTESGLELLGWNKEGTSREYCRIKLYEDDVDEFKDILIELMKKAYDNRGR